MLVELFGFIAAAYIFVKILYHNYCKRWSHFQDAPLPKTTLFGHLPALKKLKTKDLFANVHTWLESSKDDCIVLWLGLQPLIFTRNKKIFEELLSSNKHISKSSSYWVLKEWLGNTLTLITGDHWKKNRKILTPSFHFNTLSDFILIMEKHSIDLCKHLQTYAECEKSFNVFDLMKLYSFGIIMETAMGIDCNIIEASLKSEEEITIEEKQTIDFLHTLHNTLDSLSIRQRNPLYWYKPIYKLFPKGQQYYKNLKEMTSFAREVTEKRIKNMQVEKSVKDKSNRKIFLDNILVHYQSGFYSIEDILKETQSFILGGFDTISTALSWCLYLLGRNLDKQEIAYKELTDIKRLNLPIQKILPKMHYLECVIKESLRIHPPFPVIGRHLEEEAIFDSLTFPKGSAIQICLLGSQRNAKNWENPMQFQPERFLNVEEGVNIKENTHFTYVPFSAGPRNCIGQRFAMHEMKITLYYLLLQFEVIALQKEEEIVESNTIIHGIANENGLQIKLKPRNGKFGN